MKPVLEIKVCWLKKALFCWAFFGFLTAKSAMAYGLPPLISVPPVGVTVQNGGTAHMTATVGVSLTPLTVTWMFNGHAIQNPNVSNVTVPIVGTTVSTLTVPNCSPAEAGKYSVYVQNSGGSVTSADGLLVVLNLAILNNGTGLGNGGFHLNVVKPANSNCVVEATTDFSHWTPIYTNNSGSTNINYVDSAATNMPLRYYRLRLQ